MRKSNKLIPEGFAEFLGICFGCWFLSIGISLLIDVQFVKEFGVSVILCQNLIAIVLCGVCSRKWWIPIALFVVPSVIFLLLTLVSDNFAQYGKDVVGFIKWCTTNLKPNSEFYSEKNIDLAHMLSNIGITALLFVIQRITRKSWVLAFLSLGVIIVTYAFGFTQYNKIAILFFFVGAFTLMALDEFNGHKLFKYGHIYNGIGYKWSVNLISLILCFTISFGTLALLNNDKKLDVRNRFCSNIAADVQTATDFYTTEQQQLDITLYDMGLQSSKKNLGGKLPEMPSVVLAETTLKKSSLLKVTTFDTYTGKRWTNDFEKSYRFNGYWTDNQRRFLSGKIARNSDKYRILSNFYVRNNVKVTLKETSYFLPTFEQTLGLTENTKTKNPILFDERGRLISYFGQEKGFSYTLDTFSFDLTIPTKEQRLAIAHLITQPDYYYTKEFREHYTKLQIKLPQNVIDDIENMNIKGRNSYYILQSVLSYFSTGNGFKYTENVDNLPNNTEICSTFFKYKKGHCVYFSTAIIAMLRYLDVPSRLAAGYLTVKNSKGVQVINAANPFCWVECYLPNIGWISINPAPHRSVGSLSINQSSQYKAPEKEEEKPEEPEKPKEEEKPEEPKKPKQNKPQNKSVNYTLIFTYLSIVLLAVYVTLRGLWTPLIYKPKIVFRRFRSPKKRVKIYWRGISRLLKNLGYPSEKPQTIREQYLKIAPTLTEEQNDILLKAICVCEDTVYSPKLFKCEDAVLLYDATSMLEDLCSQRKNPILNYIKRSLRPLF